MSEQILASAQMYLSDSSPLDESTARIIAAVKSIFPEGKSFPYESYFHLQRRLQQIGVGITATLTSSGRTRRIMSIGTIVQIGELEIQDPVESPVFSTPAQISIDA